MNGHCSPQGAGGCTWHWTLDDSNPGRVSIRTYAKAVGRSAATIAGYVNAYAKWREGVRGTSNTFAELVEREKLSAERAAVVEAVAEVNRVELTTASRLYCPDIRTQVAAGLDVPTVAGAVFARPRLRAFANEARRATESVRNSSKTSDLAPRAGRRA